MRFMNLGRKEKISEKQMHLNVNIYIYIFILKDIVIV